MLFRLGTQNHERESYVVPFMVNNLFSWLSVTDFQVRLHIAYNKRQCASSNKGFLFFPPIFSGSLVPADWSCGNNIHQHWTSENPLWLPRESLTRIPSGSQQYPTQLVNRFYQQRYNVQVAKAIVLASLNMNR